MDEEKFKRKAKKILIEDPKYKKGYDIEIAVQLIWEWFDAHRKIMDAEIFDQIMAKAELKKKANEEFAQLLNRSKKLGFH